MSECEIVKTKRGKDMCEGHSYHLSKQRAYKYYWRCTRKDAVRCSVFVTTELTNNEHVFVKKNHDHCHLPDPEKKIVANLKTSIKVKAKSSMDAPSQIIQRCVQDIPATSAPYMPNRDAMRTMIHRERNKNLPKLPKTVQEIVIPDELTKVNCKQYLIGQFLEENECVVVFATEENCRFLNKAPYWLMDGTFRCCPQPFVQIY